MTAYSGMEFWWLVKNTNTEINVKNADCKNFIVFFIDTHFLSGFIEGTTIKNQTIKKK